MPTAKNKKTKLSQKEIQLTKEIIEQLLVFDRSLNLGTYLTFGFTSIIFILSLFFILDNEVKGLFSFVAIALGSLIAAVLAWYSIKPFGAGKVNRILVNGLAGQKPEEFISNVEKLMKTKGGLVKFFNYQAHHLFQLSETKRSALERSITVLIVTLLIGLIFILALP